MGSAASRVAVRAVPKTAPKTVPNRSADSIQKEFQRAPQATPREEGSAQDSRVTARVRGEPVPFRRKTNTEWAETLKNISSAITSSPWEGEVSPSLQNEMDKSRHSAQRSDKTNMKLPVRPDPRASQDSENTKQIMKGRLTQNQVIALFNLRRREPERWTAARIAERFGIEEGDARNLLNFTRTYTGRLDDDGETRGYYRVDKNDTVERFERE